MATNQGRQAKKLYFDVLLTATRSSQSFLCTQFTAGTPGDRYGSLLKALEACTASTPAGVRQQRAVGAWFAASFYGPQNTTTAQPRVTTTFVQPTANGNNLSLTSLPYVTSGGTVANKIGQTATDSVTSGVLRHFGVQVSKTNLPGGTVSVRGVLYVQRQHSIEV
jgi:hypothetical protein